MFTFTTSFFKIQINTNYLNPHFGSVQLFVWRILQSDRQIHQRAHQRLDLLLELHDELGEVGARVGDRILLRGQLRGENLDEGQPMEFELERTALGRQLSGVERRPVQGRFEVARVHRLPDAMQFGERFAVDLLAWQLGFL